MNEIKKIDIHAHARPFKEMAPIYGCDHPFIFADEVLAFYDKLNVEKGVLLPLVSPEYHVTPITSGECYYSVQRHPDRFFWFCGIDPRALGNDPKADLTPLLEYYKSLGAKGVGELTAQFYVDDPFIDNLFYHCAMCDMPVTIHLAHKFGGGYGMVDELGLPRLERMLKKHKKLKILGHSQVFWSEMGNNVNEENRMMYVEGPVKEGRIAELMREYENLYCDFSAGSGANAMMRDPDHAARFIEEFSDRILYGCDICQTFNTHPYNFDSFLDRMLQNGMVSKENYYKFVRGNALELLKENDEEGERLWKN